jgi:hypothetical protein
MDRVLGGTVLLLLPFLGAVIVAGTAAAIITPIAAAGTSAVWRTILNSAKECL